MTLDLVPLQTASARDPGYAGALEARNPQLAGRFHFWRGASGHRYACTRVPVRQVPAYEEAIALFVRRRGGEASVIGIGTPGGRSVLPFGTDEVHVHIVQGGSAAFDEALADLEPLVIRRASLYAIDRRAA
jgi:hypothetical protein